MYKQPFGLTSPALKNACEVLQNCLADVKGVTPELNVKGELWKITHFKMSSVTSGSPGRGFDRVAKMLWSNT